MKTKILVLLVVIILVSCAPAIKVIPTETVVPVATFPTVLTSTFTPVPSPSFTPVPTVTITPTPIPMIDVEGQNIPDPKTSNPELFDLTKFDSPIVQFANAFGVKPEEVGNLTPQIHIGVDGKQFIVLTTGDLSATANFDESGIPLMIAEQGKNGDWKWSMATKGKIATIHGRLDGSNFETEKPPESKITLEQFNLSFVSGNASKLRNIHPSKGIFLLSNLRTEISRASSTGNPVIVHGLIWGEKLDDKKVTWDEGMTNEEIIQEAVVIHITNIAGAEGIKGNVFAYTLNEPGGEEDRLWQANPDYLRIASETIRAVDPNVTIILNIPENMGSKYGDNNPGLSKKLAIELFNAGLIDVVGIQGHIMGATPPTDQQIEAAFNRFKTPDGVQIPIWITELDVNMKGVDDPSYLKQAAIMERFVNKITVLGCNVINNWMIGDKNSWLEEPPFEGRRSPNANGTLFDDNLRPKPSYFASIRALLQANSNH